MAKKEKHFNTHVYRKYMESQFFAQCGEPICKIISLLKSDEKRFEIKQDLEGMAHPVVYTGIRDKINGFYVKTYRNQYVGYGGCEYSTNHPWITPIEAQALDYFTQPIINRQVEQEVIERINKLDRAREEAKKLYDI